MNHGRTVFAQLLDFVPFKHFEYLVEKFLAGWPRAIELFFKWLKQNLSVKHFFGNSLNAVKSQIWIAVCVYLLVIIAKKSLAMEVSPPIFLNLIEVNMFEKITINPMVTDALLNIDDPILDNQLNLFTF